MPIAIPTRSWLDTVSSQLTDRYAEPMVHDRFDGGRSDKDVFIALASRLFVGLANPMDSCRGVGPSSGLVYARS